MKYEVLIYVGKDIITALNVLEDKHEYIRVKGNQEHPAGDVNGFYKNLLHVYNVKELSDLDVRVRIINGGATSETIQSLCSCFTKVKRFSLWSVEEILPIMVLQKSMIERNSSVSLELYGEYYNVISDCYYNISVKKSSDADVKVTLEDFVYMDKINGDVFLSNTNEMKNIKICLLEIQHRMDETDEELSKHRSNNIKLGESLSTITDTINDMNDILNVVTSTMEVDKSSKKSLFKLSIKI